MAKKVRLLFTGPNKAEYNMGDKMREVARKAVEKHGFENVTLVHGGRPEKNIIDKNIIRVGELSGLKVESDPLDYTIPKNAANIRTQKRIDDPNLEWHSFNSEGDLKLKDKYEGYWRDYYKSLGKETIGKGDVRPEGSLRFPKKKYKKDAQGKPTKDLQSQSTLETSKFKSLLDKVEDDTNLQRRLSGVRFAKNKDTWTKKNIGFNLITEKNQPRIDFIEHGAGLPTGQTTYIAQEQQIYEVSPTTMGRTGWQETGDKQTEFVDDTRGELNDAGLRKLPFKAESRGTLLAPIQGVRNVTKSFEVRGYGTEGSTFDHKTKKAIPIIRNYTVKETRKISAGSKKPPSKKFVGGPDTYSSRSSWSQLGNVELAGANETTEARNLRSGTTQTVEADEMQRQIIKREDAQSVKRHTYEYGKSQQGELNKDVTDLIDRVKQVKSLQRKNKRIQRTGNKQKFIGTRSPAVKRLLNTVPDAL